MDLRADPKPGGAAPPWKVGGLSPQHTGEGPDRCVSQEDAHEKMLNTVSHPGHATQRHDELSLPTHEDGCNQNNRK